MNNERIETGHHTINFGSNCDCENKMGVRYYSAASRQRNEMLNLLLEAL